MVEITISARAKAALKAAYFEHAAGTDQYFRLSFNNYGKLGFMLDWEKPGDYVVEYEGIKVLLVGTDVATLVEGAALELKETDEGPKVNVKIP